MLKKKKQFFLLTFALDSVEREREREQQEFYKSMTWDLGEGAGRQNDAILLKFMNFPFSFFFLFFPRHCSSSYYLDEQYYHVFGQ